MIQIIAVSLLAILSIGLPASARADGPYHGKVVDSETKAPIEGAVVVAVWFKREIANRIPIYLVAKEVLTDKNGEFEIPGYTHLPIGFSVGVQWPEFYIFKPGYGDLPRRTFPKHVNRLELSKYFATSGLVELPRVKDRTERKKVLQSIRNVWVEVKLDPELANYRQFIDDEEIMLGQEATDWKGIMADYLACETKSKTERGKDGHCSGTPWKEIIERYETGCKTRRWDPYCQQKNEEKRR